MTNVETQKTSAGSDQIKTDQPPILYLGLGGGEDLWATTATAQVTVFSLSELEAAKAIATGVDSCEDAEDIALAELATQVDAIVRGVFGPEAYVRLVHERDDETGEPLLVLEAHYGFAGDESQFEKLAALDDRFLRAYVSQVSPADRAKVVLVSIPVDADRA